jgi:integrase
MFTLCSHEKKAGVRKMASINLQSKTGRAALKPRSAPYFVLLEAGLSLGYRAASEGVGSWVARKQDIGHKYTSFTLGVFADYADAAKAARKWAGAVDAGVNDHKSTVSEVCAVYIENMKTQNSERSAKDNNSRFKRLVYSHAIGNVVLSKLKPEHIRAWLNAQVSVDADADEEDIRKSKDSANRNFNALKAALNMAHRDGKTSTKPWEAVSAFAKVAKGRAENSYLTPEESHRLISHMNDDMATFTKALLLTGFRAGEIARVTAQDFDRKQGTLQVNGKTGSRTVTLSTAAREFFASVSADKIGQAVLFQRADGLPWGKDYWKKCFTKARNAARLPEIVLYSIRHTAISNMINAGMDSHIVAKLAGTSTVMIDRNYGYLRHDKVRAMLDAAMG